MRKITMQEFNVNTPIIIGKEWMLVTSGTLEKHNTMTASWGGFGHLWNKDVAFVFVRPQRYTYEFVEENEYMTLSFYDGSYRDALMVLGTKSGRDTNKEEEVNFHPVQVDESVAFEEAKYVLKCRKLYADDLKGDSILDEKVASCYPDKDYHRMYVVEIEAIYVND